MCRLLSWLNDCCSSSLASISLVSISLWATSLFKATWQAWLESLGWKGMQEVRFWKPSETRALFDETKSLYILEKKPVYSVKLWGLQTSRTFPPLAEPHYPHKPSEWASHAPGTFGWFFVGRCATCPRDPSTKTVNIWYRPSKIATPGWGQYWIRWKWILAKRLHGIRKTLCNHVFTCLCVRVYQCIFVISAYVPV